MAHLHEARTRDIVLHQHTCVEDLDVHNLDTIFTHHTSNIANLGARRELVYGVRKLNNKELTP